MEYSCSLCKDAEGNCDEFVARIPTWDAVWVAERPDRHLSAIMGNHHSSVSQNSHAVGKKQLFFLLTSATCFHVALRILQDLH